MMNVLFISYQFPPLNAGGTLRPMAFAKYLPDHGIMPLVITLAPDDYGKVYEKYQTDPAMFEELPVQVRERVTPVTTENVLNYYGSPLKRFVNIYFDVYRGKEGAAWKHHFYREADRMIKEFQPRLVFVTAPPFSIIPLAAGVCEKHQLPLVLDMRDAWTYWNMTPYGSYLHYVRTKANEQAAFRQATAVIGTSRQTIDDWKYLFPDMPAGKFNYIPNGYDADQNGTQPAAVVNLPPDPPVFRMTYIGSFYYAPESRNMMMLPWWRKRGHKMLQYSPRKQDWLYRSPYFIFKTVRELLKLAPHWETRLKLSFAGKKEPWFDEMVRTFGLEHVVEHLGFLPREACVRLEKESDVLLITSAKVLGGRDCFIAGKTFEYLQADKPVFAFTPEGAQKDLLAASGRAVIFDPDACEQAAKQMLNILEEGIELRSDPAFMESHTRRELTGQLAALMKRIAP